MRTLVVILLAAPILAQQTILLRPEVKIDPSAPPEQVEDRGKDGLHDRAISNVSQPSLTVYLPPRNTANAMAIVICPGGGYQRLAIDKEGHDVARWLTTLGVAGIVLKYRLPGREKMRPALGELRQAAEAAKIAIEDGEQAMRLVRANAAKWNLKPDAAGMMGFSAGGHLAAMMGMLAPAETRPDFLVLVYPALPQSLEVTSATPRTFLVHADDDGLVPPADHSVRFYLALKKAKVPAEMHVYSGGGHGFGTRKTGKTSQAWPESLAAWLAELGRPGGQTRRGQLADHSLLPAARLTR
ncbi:MAG: alpha/beta hydrolase [Acidobacteria bacterium]|nr:alpha/beta hydrolase [Acidobacteriota bacterium]